MCECSACHRPLESLCGRGGLELNKMDVSIPVKGGGSGPFGLRGAGGGRLPKESGGVGGGGGGEMPKICP